jgi:hypothetical protein
MPRTRSAGAHSARTTFWSRCADRRWYVSASSGVIALATRSRQPAAKAAMRQRSASRFRAARKYAKARPRTASDASGWRVQEYGSGRSIGATLFHMRA